MEIKKSSLPLDKFYPEDLSIITVDQNDNIIRLFMKSNTKQAICPKCGLVSQKYHATHHRKVQDLPMLGRQVILDINLFEYKCENNDCTVTTFTETYDGFFNSYCYMTERLVDLVTSIAIETSCESCARILNSMNVKISGDTVIRTLIKRFDKQPEQVCGATIGIDDFAFKKRQTYGTIIVNENDHKPVAILEGRDGETLKEWLKQNKHVKVVTRDRASAYAKAIEEILPDCMQVADRFHLHQNLLESINKVLGREIPSTIAIDETKKDECITTNSDDTINSKKNRICCG